MDIHNARNQDQAPICTMRIERQLKNKEGVVLLSTLLFLLVVTLLVTTVIHVGLLQTKTTTNYRDMQYSLILAEQKLRKNEKQFMRSGCVAPKCKIISTAVCGVTICRITGKGVFGRAKTVLQSSYAKLNRDNQCSPNDHRIRQGRYSWREIS